MTTPILLVFLAALLLAAGAVLLLFKLNANTRADEVNLRMRVLGEDAANDKFGAATPELGNPVVRAVSHLFWRAGIELPPESIGRGLLLFAALIPVLLLMFGPLAGALAIGLAEVIVFGVLSRNAARRRRKIVEQLPTFLEGVMRVLSAGNTLEESLAAAAREAPDPIRPLFISIGRQVRLGAPLETVLTEAGGVHRLRDLRVMALAAAINRKYGGSLRHVLKSLITNIRQRDVAARELRALTAETRFSAVVLAIIPVSLSFYIFSKNKAYYATMWEDPTGRWLLVASVLLQIAGVAVLFSMMRDSEGDDT
ncbi:MAG: type II secretion system F family protein [Stagnimonas sp.]|nr:type II secretion system F family protein [Stagnimonas sp.]